MTLCKPRSKLFSLVLASIGAMAAYLTLFRPRLLRWGATTEEVQQPLPGDELIPQPFSQSTRAVIIDAPPAAVWAWLVQIGQGRGGFYSYDWLENLLGLDIHSADRLVPALQELEVGDIIFLAPSGGPAMQVAQLEPERTLVLRAVGTKSGQPIDRADEAYWDYTWTIALTPIDRQRTRLMIRGRGDAKPKQLNILNFLAEPLQFVMERKMLDGLKQRAERSPDAVLIGLPGVNASGLIQATLLDKFLPAYEYRGAESVVIQAPLHRIFEAVKQVTLEEMPLASVLGQLRYAPKQAMEGKVYPAPTGRPFINLVLESGNIVLAEDTDQEFVIGAIGKFHQLFDQAFVSLDNAEAFMTFDQPDYQKLVQSFRIAGGNEADGYTLVFEHRTHGLSPASRRKFDCYWLIIKPASAILVRVLLDAIKNRAELPAAEEDPAGSDQAQSAPLPAQ